MKSPQTDQDFFDGLDEEEAEILRASRSGGLVSVANFEEEKAILSGGIKTPKAEKLGASSRNRSTKRSAITIRVPNDDLAEIKREAEETGTPYQTIIVSVLHRYTKK